MRLRLLGAVAAGLVLSGATPVDGSKTKPPASRMERALDRDVARARAGLAVREDALELRQRLVAAQELRLERRRLEIAAAVRDMARARAALATATDARVVGLATTFAAMKPREAARVAAALDPALRVAVARQLKPRTLAALMNGLPTDVAAALSAGLTGRKPLQTNDKSAISTRTGAPAAAEAAAPASAASAATSTDRPGSAPSRASS